jgi:hypothetical protein
MAPTWCLAQALGCLQQREGTVDYSTSVLNIDTIDQPANASKRHDNSAAEQRPEDASKECGFHLMLP